MILLKIHHLDLNCDLYSMPKLMFGKLLVFVYFWMECK